MAANPQAFFRFAADHYPLLVDLFYRAGGVNDAELLALAERHRAATGPAPAYLAEQCLALGFLEAAPDATATYELTRPVRSLLGVLLMEHRLTSAAVLQGYLDDLGSLGRELDQALAAARGNQAVRALAEVGDLLERVRQDSRSNREGIVGEVLRIKANRDRRSVRERFEEVNRLWSRYLEPLRDLIDVRKAMDQTLDGLDRLLRQGLEVFALDGTLSRELGRARLRLLRVRREAAEDFREAVREIEPLYQALRRESELVRGASRALERIRREGLRCLDWTGLLALPAWRREGLFPDPAAEAYLRELRGYEPGRPHALPEAGDGEPPGFLDPDEVARALAQDAPLPDLLAWLAGRWPGTPLSEVLRAYGRLHAATQGRQAFGAEEQEYRIAGVRVIAHPLEVEAP
ncbi:MAG: hypothetical protein ACYDA8_12930 [Deferrisomatales bacterium]